MSAKGKYGFYTGPKETFIYWPDGTGWFLHSLTDEDIWVKGSNGWDHPEDYIEGAALVAPLTILYWKKNYG